MPDCHFENFDLAVLGQTGPYTVRAAYAGRSAEGELALDRGQGDWPERLARLLAAARPPGRAWLEETGAQLFNALWRDQVRDLWLLARSDLERGALAGLSVRLSVSPPEVAALPWEALYDAERGVHLGAANQTPLARVVDLHRYLGAPRSPVSRLPLRVLVALPEDPTGQIDAEHEWRSLQTALAPLLDGGLQLLRLDGRFDLLELRRRLQQEQPHVLHLLTHGRPDGVLLWQDGKPQLAPPPALRLALDGADSLRLVLLAACSTGQVFDHSPLSSLGAQLLQTGAPAVIAMQVDVHATAAAAFSEHFYRQLLAGRCAGLVQVAANYARSCLYLREPDQFAFAAPVLWLNAADGRIFTPDRRFTLPAPVLAPAAVPAPAAPALDVAVLLDELAALESWLASVPEFARASVPPDLRGIEAGRRQHIQDVRDQLALLAGEDAAPARARRFERQRAALLAHREQIDRLTELLRGHLRRDAGAS
jgi:hypothetical protein